MFEGLATSTSGVVCLHGLDVRDGRAVPPGLGSGLFPVWQEFSIHIGLSPYRMGLKIPVWPKISIQVRLVV